MARGFNGSSDAISWAVNLSPYAIITLAMWVNWTTFANDDHLMAEYTANSASNQGGFIIDPNESGSGTFQFGLRNGINVWVDSITRPSAAVYIHYAFVFNRTAPSNKLYLNGVNQSLTTVVHDANIQGTAFNNSTLYLMSRAATSLWAAGSMSDVSLWSLELTQGEILALAKGARPYTVRPGSEISYLPLDGLKSPEPDLSGNAKNGTLAGTSLANGPPATMFTPRWPINSAVAAAPSTIFRKTASRIGTRTGSRQIWAA